jgi:hypothetical protein
LAQKNVPLYYKFWQKKLIVDDRGSIIDYELNKPFVYLHEIAEKLNENGDRNTSSRLLEKSNDEFLESLRFENRGCLAELPVSVDNF